MIAPEHESVVGFSVPQIGPSFPTSQSRREYYQPRLASGQQQPGEQDSFQSFFLLPVRETHVFGRRKTKIVDRETQSKMDL